MCSSIISSLLQLDGLPDLTSSSRFTFPNVLNSAYYILHTAYLPHPPYLPDLSPSQCHLLLALDNDMEIRQLQNKEDHEN